MSEKPGAIAPSKIAITKLLAEIESTRKHATKHWFLALLLPFLVGVGLLTYTSREIYVRLEDIKELDKTIAEKQGIIREQTATITHNGEALQEFLRLLQAAATANPEAGQAIIKASSANPKTAPTRVFIYIHVEELRSKARQVAQALKGAGYTVPDIERRRKEVDVNQVKFWQEDRKAAEKVVRILKDQGVSDAKLVPLRGNRPSPSHIEVWVTTSTPVPETGEKPSEVKGDEVKVVRLHGQLTAENAGAFQSLLASLRQEKHRKLLIDLGDVSKIDEHGLRALVSEYTATNREGGQLKLLNVTKRITDLLTLTKLLTVFDVYEDEGEAIRSFGE